MHKYTFDIDYTYCPQGHYWKFAPASLLYADIFWCPQCDCFYVPSVQRVERGSINAEFSSDREREIIHYADFLTWRSQLRPKDMDRIISTNNIGR